MSLNVDTNNELFTIDSYNNIYQWEQLNDNKNTSTINNPDYPICEKMIIVLNNNDMKHNKTLSICNNITETDLSSFSELYNNNNQYYQ